MRGRLTLAILLGAAVAGIASQLAAQTSRDTLHTRAQKTSIDSIASGLDRYCALKSRLSYMLPACRAYQRLSVNEAALTTTTLPFAPACVRGDTTTSPIYTVVGLCQPEPIDTTARRYVSGPTTSLLSGLATVVTGPQQWTATIPGAQWVWKSATLGDPTRADTANFYQSFTATATKPVSIDIAADDGYAIWLNGRLIVDSLGVVNQTTYQRSAHFTLPQTALVVGANTLLFVVRNAPSPAATSPSTNPAGLLYAVTLVVP
jgi:hypothetical protein